MDEFCLPSVSGNLRKRDRCQKLNRSTCAVESFVLSAVMGRDLTEAALRNALRACAGGRGVGRFKEGCREERF